MLQTFKQMFLLFIVAPGRLYLVISYRWCFGHLLLNAKPNGSIPFFLSCAYKLFSTSL